MDSGWAVVIGAVVAFAGSIIGSVFGPYWTAQREHTRRREEQRRDDIRAALTGTIDGLGRMLMYRHHNEGSSAFLPTIDSITRLGLAIDSAEGPIEDLALQTMNVIQTGDIYQSGAALAAYQTTAHHWYRGDIRGDQVRQRYAAELAQSSKTAATRAAQDRAAH